MVGFNFRRRRAECFDAITRLRPYVESEQLPEGPAYVLDFIKVLREVADRQILFGDLTDPEILGICDNRFDRETEELLKISRELRLCRICPPMGDAGSS